ITSAGVDPFYERVIAARFASVATNPLMAALLAIAPLTTARRESVVPDEQYLKTDLYNEAIGPQRLRHVALACVLRTSDELVPCGVLRDWRQGPLDARELHLLDAVLPHMQRA